MLHKPQIFTQDERDKISPRELCYIILNNLDKLDNEPEKIEAILDKFDQLNDQNYSNPLKTFMIPFNKVYGFYKTQKRFPGMDWIEVNLENFDVQRNIGNYSRDIYDSLIEYLDKLIVKLILSKNVTDKEDYSYEDLDRAITEASIYRNKRTVNIERLDWEDIEALQEQRENEPPGVKTGIEEIDEVIIELPNGSLSVINAPTGNGKTLLSSTILYNNAVLQGKHVIYVAFEAREHELWANLGSIESTHLGINQSHSTWKLRIGEGEEKKKERIDSWRECSKSIKAKLKENGGYVNILTYKTLPENTFEDFCARLEKESELKGKKADLIIIDNVDNLGLFPYKGSDFRSVMNNRISHLDAFAETYYNHEGTHILLLSQSNRAGMDKLEANEDPSADVSNDLLSKPRVQKRNSRPPTIDGRVISDYSALSQKAKIGIVCAISDEARRKGVIKIFFIKVRDIGKPPDPVEIYTDFKHSMVGGKVKAPSVEEYLNFQKKEEELKKMVEETKEIKDVPPLDYDFID